MNAKINMELAGEFELIVRSPRGDRTYLAPNMVLNSGLDQAFQSNDCWKYVQIGTGNTAPAATDTALQSLVTNTGTVQTAPSATYVAGPPDYVQTSVTFRFAIGALNSAVSGNFAEVGIGWTTSGNLFSRALITDVNGNPTTISVLSDEQLDVVYRLRVYPIQTDVTGSITLDGVSYNYTIRPQRVNKNNHTSYGRGWWGVWPLFYYTSGGIGFSGSGSGGNSGSVGSDDMAHMTTYTGGIGARTSAPATPSGTLSATAVSAPLTYTLGSYARAHEYTWNLNDGNAAGGIKSLTVPLNANAAETGCCFMHQVEFSPVIPKDATKRLKLTFTYSLANRP